MLPFQPNSPDDFQTPPHALKPLLKYLPKEQVIWECACGNGNLVKALRREGYKVRGTDLKSGKNFLSWCPRPDMLPLKRWAVDAREGGRKPLGSVIVTNPPYSLKDEFLITACCIGLPFALLMPLTALEGRSRQWYYRRFGIELIVRPERVHFQTPSGKPSHCWFPVAWFCRKLTNEKLIIAPAP